MMAKRTGPTLNPLVIDTLKTVQEIHTKSIELVRLTRVTYRGERRHLH